ncbi:MAG: peptidoglycan-associated outer rane lipoprotein [Verrucomicrobiota bacterium]|jgi:peptidoglycan-associated lipoprotein
MKRFTFLLAVAALSVGCTSRIPEGFSPLSSGNSAGGPDSLDTRSVNARRDALANAIRSGNIPPEAILTTVYFEFDKYTVSASERAKVDAVAGRVKATEVIIAGYTDHFGTEEYNLGLSDRRAQSVRDYLVKLGANQGKAEVMALGSQHADKNAAGRQSGAKDRKAIIVDVNYSGPVSSGAARPAAPAAAGAAPAPVPSAL